MIEIRGLAIAEFPQALPRLSALLVACVRAGASVEFLASVTSAQADEYWSRAFGRGADGLQRIFVATSDEAIIGTVSLVRASQQNQQHRGDISKLLVDPSARRQGVADRLMDHAEAEAWSRGLTTLVLDTVSGSDASRLYERRGWNRAGDIPDYALSPAGEMCSTTFYWKSAP